MARSKSMNTAEGMAHEYMVSWFRGCSFSATKDERNFLTQLFTRAYKDGHENFIPPNINPCECSKESARAYTLEFALTSGRISNHEWKTLDGFIQACYKQGQTRAYIERLEALCGKGVDQ